MTFSSNVLTEITDRYVRGEDIYQISKAVGLPVADILVALQQVYEKLKISIPFKFNDANIIQLSKLDKAESEAWKAWDMSKKPKQRKTSKATKKGKGENTEGVLEDKDNKQPDKMEQQLNIEDREGSPAYLNIVINCVKLRMELLRLK